MGLPAGSTSVVVGAGAGSCCSERGQEHRGLELPVAASGAIALSASPGIKIRTAERGEDADVHHGGDCGSHALTVCTSLSMRVDQFLGRRAAHFAPNGQASHRAPPVEPVAPRSRTAALHARATFESGLVLELCRSRSCPVCKIGLRMRPRNGPHFGAIGSVALQT